MNKLNNCPICHATDIHWYNSNTDRRKGLPGKWDLWVCKQCSVLFMNPMPTKEELDTYYSSYYLDGDKNKDSNKKISRRYVPRKLYYLLRKFYHFLSGDVDPRDFIQIKEGEHILDYGCGNGTYLTYFHENGINIIGTEIADNPVRNCKKKGYKIVYIENLENLPFSENEFDIIYLMQVFEHIHLPHIFLDELHRIIKQTGEIYLAIPNYKSSWRYLFREYWISGWFSPFHLFHYDKQSIQKLANLHHFEVIDSWSSTPESWFRLNLKAILNRSENKLEQHKIWLDNSLIRFGVMLFLRLSEFFLTEKDCLVVKLKRRNFI